MKWTHQFFQLKTQTTRRRRIQFPANLNINKNTERKGTILSMPVWKKHVWNKWRDSHPVRKDRQANRISINQRTPSPAKASKRQRGWNLLKNPHSLIPGGLVLRKISNTYRNRILQRATIIRKNDEWYYAYLYLLIIIFNILWILGIENLSIEHMNRRLFSKHHSRIDLTHIIKYNHLHFSGKSSLLLQTKPRCVSSLILLCLTRRIWN